ncbi:hypothetical protein [Palleronia sediminis]|nr:hypothetical protein [Palleronia sediminis]
MAAILCALVLGGQTEVSHPYSVGYDLHRIRVDCETATHVVEVGLDKRSSLDSLQQALFAASLTGKTPMIAIVDTDGREGPYEFRIRTAAEKVGVAYEVWHSDWLIRRQMTDWLRENRGTGPGS